ncbi:hypothetical protein [Arenimonas sp. MALMAid1274]|uniref:hypothetical protein n=1 Tax=Arenimonas sp. MALMAid1274 TaxID=3411630 RepID=UPI003BA2B346
MSNPLRARPVLVAAALVIFMALQASTASTPALGTKARSHFSPTVKGQPSDSLDGLVAQWRATAGQDNHRQSLRAVHRVLDHPGFAGLDAGQRHIAHRDAGWLAMQLGDYAQASEQFSLSLAIGDTDPDVRYWRSRVALVRGQPDAAADDLASFARKWPQLLDNLDDNHFWYVMNSLDLDRHARSRTGLLQALFDADWKRTALGGASYFWFELALVRINSGDEAGARAAIARITQPAELVKLLADKRFDAIVDPAAPQFDVERAAADAVTDLRLQAILDPQRLGILTAMGNAMMVIGEFEDVVALSDQVRSEIAAADSDNPPYRDMDQLVWMLDLRSNALRRLERTDEALAEMKAASQLDEQGNGNVSQILNLAHFYCSLDRPDDTLATLAALSAGASPYGKMVQASARLCAATQSGDARAAAQALDYIRSHRSDSEAIYLEALVMAGQLEGAAATLIAQLESPRTRANTLASLQDFRGGTELPGDRLSNENWRTLEAREDVQAAVRRVGRILSHDIHAP